MAIILKNGALVMAKTVTPERAIVLCNTQGHSAHAFATWEMNPQTGDTFWGHYFHTYAEAQSDYAERASAVLASHSESRGRV